MTPNDLMAAELFHRSEKAELQRTGEHQHRWDFGCITCEQHNCQCICGTCQTCGETIDEREVIAETEQARRWRRRR